MINVVHYEMARRVEYFTVHTDRNILFADAFFSVGVEGSCILSGIPFVFIQSLEIHRIDDGIFSLSKLYPAEGVAVAGPAVQHRQSYYKPCQPVRNRYRDGKVELNTTLHFVEIRISKL